MLIIISWLSILYHLSLERINIKWRILCVPELRRVWDKPDSFTGNLGHNNWRPTWGPVDFGLNLKMDADLKMLLGRLTVVVEKQAQQISDLQVVWYAPWRGARQVEPNLARIWLGALAAPYRNLARTANLAQLGARRKFGSTWRGPQICRNLARTANSVSI